MNTAQMKRFRFVCSTATGNDLSITDADLSSLLMSVISGSSTGTELIAGFKIKRLRFWTPYADGQPLGGSSVPVGPAITWLGGGLASDKTICCQSLSSARPALLDTRPPRNSQAAFWGLGAGNSNTYFSINGSVLGSYIDLDMQIILALGSSTTRALTASSTVTGVMYGRLDGASGSWQAITGGIAAAE